MEKLQSMVTVQVNLNEEEDETVRLVKALEDIGSKERAIKHIIRQFKENNERY